MSGCGSFADPSPECSRLGRIRAFARVRTAHCHRSQPVHRGAGLVNVCPDKSAPGALAPPVGAAGVDAGGGTFVLRGSTGRGLKRADREWTLHRLLCPAGGRHQLRTYSRSLDLSFLPFRIAAVPAWFIVLPYMDAPQAAGV